jgi:hypothetical protein
MTIAATMSAIPIVTDCVRLVCASSCEVMRTATPAS